MLVRMRHAINGYRNEQPWPPIGGTIELPDHEAADMIAAGYAEVAEHDVDENDLEPEAPTGSDGDTAGTGSDTGTAEPGSDAGTAEPGSDGTTEPVTEPVTEPATEPVTEPDAGTSSTEPEPGKGTAALRPTGKRRGPAKG